MTVCRSVRAKMSATLCRGAAARHSGSVGGGATMHASTRPGSRWRTGCCVHGQSPVREAALQRPAIAETALETCFAQGKGAPPTPRLATMAWLGESALVGGRSTVPARDFSNFVPKGQREVPHGGSCSIRDDARASWPTREHLCDTVRGGGEEEGAEEARSTEQKRESRQENRWQADNARIRETVGNETLNL